MIDGRQPRRGELFWIAEEPLALPIAAAVFMSSSINRRMIENATSCP